MSTNNYKNSVNRLTICRDNYKTEEEFRKQAELSTKHVINRRLKREEDKRANKS